jgi:integrase
MGLGSARDVSLKVARELAVRWREIASQHRDPIVERDREAREARRNGYTLRQIALDAFESRKAELRAEGVAGRWFSPLELHVLPKLGSMPVGEITQTAIRDTLAPLWHAKAETARKALSRLRICLRHAAALDLEVDIQAPEKAMALLGKQLHKVENIPALPWQEVPAFYSTLTDKSVCQLALRLVILTAVRSRPIRFISEEQIDGNVWTIPGEGMKGRRDATEAFRVPLTSEALDVVEIARRLHSRNGYLFANVSRGVISDMTMSRYMERAGMRARPHGFRSSLRDWLAEATDAPREIAEMMLGHSVGNDVERAYRRTDFLEQRRALAERWTQHVLGIGGQVVRLAVA